MSENENHDLTKDIQEKAEFYILNQKYSEALKILKPVVETEDASAHAHYLYGLALEGTNQQEDAKKHFRRVIEIEPDHTEAHEHLDNLIG